MRTSGTLLIGAPLKRVKPALPGTLFHPVVTAGRLVIDCVSAGKLACSAESSWAWDRWSVFSKNASSPGSSAVTDDSGIACRSAVTCGKFFCSAPST